MEIQMWNQFPGMSWKGTNGKAAGMAEKDLIISGIISSTCKEPWGLILPHFAAFGLGSLLPCALSAVWTNTAFSSHFAVVYISTKDTSKGECGSQSSLTPVCYQGWGGSILNPPYIFINLVSDITRQWRIFKVIRPAVSWEYCCQSRQSFKKWPIYRWKILDINPATRSSLFKGSFTLAVCSLPTVIILSLWHNNSQLSKCLWWL